MRGFIMGAPAGLNSAEGEVQISDLICSCPFATWAIKTGSGAPSSPSLPGGIIPEAGLEFFPG